MKKKTPAVELPQGNAFQTVRPRGGDTPTHSPPAKRGPKATSGTGLVLNIRGRPQATLKGRALEMPTRQEWKATNDKLLRNAKASI